jgi:hypothetical protein
MDAVLLKCDRVSDKGLDRMKFTILDAMKLRTLLKMMDHTKTAIKHQQID